MVNEKKFYKMKPLYKPRYVSVDELLNIDEYTSKKCRKCGKLELIDFGERKPIFQCNKYSGKYCPDVIAYDGVPINTNGWWMIVSEKFVDWFNKSEFKGAIFYQAEIVTSGKEKNKIDGIYYVMFISGHARLDFKGMKLESMRQCDYCGAYFYETEHCPLFTGNIYPTLIELTSWDGSDIFYSSVCTEEFVDKILESDLIGYEFNDYASQYAGFENKTFFSTKKKWKSLKAGKDIVKKDDIKKREKRIERDSCFCYVSNLDDDVKQEIMSMIIKGIDIFKFEDMKDGKKIAEKIDNIVKEILATGKYPDEFDDIEDVAVTLGCLYGKALEVGYGWCWKEIGKTKEEAEYCVVSADENWVNPCLKYIYSILKEKNRGLDGENDVTCLLLYNMIGNSLNYIPEKKFTIIC